MMTWYSAFRMFSSEKPVSIRMRSKVDSDTRGSIFFFFLDAVGIWDESGRSEPQETDQRIIPGFSESVNGLIDRTIFASPSMWAASEKNIDNVSVQTRR